MGLPGMIGERLFAVIDRAKSNSLSQADFVTGVSRLFSSKFEDNAQLVFELFDFDADGLVSAEDLRTLLSHVPITQMLGPKLLGITKEGKFTQSGAGLYAQRF